MNEKLFNSDYLIHLCQKYGLRPSKKYGQNYLINPEVVGTMSAAAEVGGGDTVVEVGPGFGALTFALAEQAKKVIAFEIEKQIQPYWDEILRSVQDDRKNIEIIWGNVLKEAGEVYLPTKKYKVVANLPYQITSQVIKYFLESKNPPTSLTLMVQKEVGERICALPGDMSVLALAVQYYAEPQIIGIVKANNFWPEPKVDSAIVQLKIKKVTPPQESTRNFFRIIHLGFAQKRKLLIKNLSSLAKRPILEEIFSKLSLNIQVRAQELSLEQWLEFIKLIHSAQK